MFVIRETETGAFCTGQNFRSFSMDMQSAAQFVSRANAEKAIKKMFHGEKNGLQYNAWTIDDKRYHSDLQAYIDQCVNLNSSYADVIRDTFTQKTAVMEVVEVKLTLVDE
jgi:hypothetical protein